MRRASFYNTTGLDGADLHGAVLAARSQDAAVLAIFEGHGDPMSASDVWQFGRSSGRYWLLTSVRRSISNLSAGDGAPLSRTDDMKEGIYGSRERLWRRTPDNG